MQYQSSRTLRVLLASSTCTVDRLCNIQNVQSITSMIMIQTPYTLKSNYSNPVIPKSLAINYDASSASHQLSITIKLQVSSRKPRAIPITITNPSLFDNCILINLMIEIECPAPIIVVSSLPGLRPSRILRGIRYASYRTSKPLERPT